MSVKQGIAAGTSVGAAVIMVTIGVLQFFQGLAAVAEDELLVQRFQDITHPDDLAGDYHAIARLLDGSASPRLRRWLPVFVVAAAIAKPNVVPMLLFAAPVVAFFVARSRRDDAEGRAVILDVLRLVVLPAAAVTALQFVIITWASPMSPGTPNRS